MHNTFNFSFTFFEPFLFKERGEDFFLACLFNKNTLPDILAFSLLQIQKKIKCIEQCTINFTQGNNIRAEITMIQNTDTANINQQKQDESIVTPKIILNSKHGEQDVKGSQRNQNFADNFLPYFNGRNSLFQNQCMTF